MEACWFAGWRGKNGDTAAAAAAVPRGGAGPRRVSQLNRARGALLCSNTTVVKRGRQKMADGRRRRDESFVDGCVLMTPRRPPRVRAKSSHMHPKCLLSAALQLVIFLESLRLGFQPALCQSQNFNEVGEYFIFGSKYLDFQNVAI
jgi:hypothetical protein